MKILIEDLRFDAIIGILPQERLTPQAVSIGCTVEYPYTQNSFIDYAEAIFLIEQTIRGEKFFLIEEALEALSILLKDRFPLIEHLSLTLRKPDILPNCTVGVQKNFNF